MVLMCHPLLAFDSKYMRLLQHKAALSCVPPGSDNDHVVDVSVLVRARNIKTV